MHDLDEAIAAWQAAIEARDAVAAGALMHDEYALLIVHPAPAEMPRAQWLGTLRDYVIHEYEIQEQRVDVLGNLATVLSRVRMKATVFGVDRSGLFILSDAWVRDGSGDRRVWTRHSSPLSAGEMPAPRSQAYSPRRVCP